MTWKLFLDAATVVPIVQMVLSGITRCRFTIHSRKWAAAVADVRILDVRMRCLRLLGMLAAIFLATLIATNTSAVAGAIKITSPNHAQTFAYGETTWRQLYLETATGGLTARITFTNLRYADFN